MEFIQVICTTRCMKCNSSDDMPYTNISFSSIWSHANSFHKYKGQSHYFMNILRHSMTPPDN